MKSKRKIDTKAIKQFFIDHTEKIVIGAVGLMFLYFAYSAVMLQVNDSYKKVPKDLEDAITTAKNTIQIGPRNKTPVAETPIPPYAEEIDTFKRPLNPNEYPFDKSIIIAPVGTRHPRGTPVIVAVQKLRAVAGRGALVSKESGTVGQRWIVVTGLFPYEDQLAEYKKMFQDANLHNDQHDVPEYIGFLVQRGEVVPGAAEPVWEKWVIFSNSKTLDNRLQNFNGEGQEVVAAANTQPALTSPLPPLAINEWDDGVACPPEINILSLQERNQNPAQGGSAAGMFQPNGQGRVRDRQIPPRGRGPAPGPAGQQQSGVDPGGDVLVGGGPAAEPVKPDANANTAQETPKYYLLRYFDFDVAPGKQYAYRAFPILRNPNYNVDAKELADLNQSQQQFLGLDTKHIQTDANGKVDGWQFSEKDWSLASRPARVSGDMRLLAGPVVEPAKPTLPTEVTGDVRILRWDEKTGDSMHGVLAERFRGMSLDSPSLIMIKADGGRTSVPVSTGCILADVTGGDPLSARDKIYSPGMILVLDDAGNLVIHDEMAETKEWVAETKVPDQPTTNRNGGRPQPGAFGRGPLLNRGGRSGPGPGPANDNSLPSNMR